MSTLLSRAATGGVVARVGFEYQDSYVLVNLPRWVAQGAFSEIISEVVGDVEVCYFTLTGTKRVFFEAKNHVLTSVSFWKELQQFKTVFDASDGLYTRFVLVAPGLPGPLSPLFNELARIKGQGASFKAGDQLLIDARAKFIKRVTGENQSSEMAQFILDYVEFEEFDAAAAATRFSGELLKALPCFEQLSGARIRTVQEKWSALVHRSFKKGVTRLELEEALLEALPETERSVWLDQPSELVLVRGVASESAPGPYAAALDVSAYTGAQRSSLTAADWANLVSSANRIGDFLISSRVRKRIRLTSELRMSAAVVIGAALKATRGHVLSLCHRESTYGLHIHERLENQTYFSREVVDGQGKEGVICIQIGGDNRADMLNALERLDLETAPQLHLETVGAVPDVQTLNTAVHQAKTAVAEFRTDGQLTVLHLFIKAPSFFAMALGHRFNGLCDTQLYDWNGTSYIATGRISP